MAAPAGEAAHGGGLRLRVISALVLAPATLALAYAGGLAFDLLVLAAAAAMAHEWNGICNKGAAAPGTVLIAAAVVVVGLAAAGRTDLALGSVPLFAILGHVAARLGHGEGAWSFVGVVYVTVPCIAIVWLRADHGLATILWLLSVVWATDVCAYAAGRGIGGPRLAPRISPKKTWAGLGGGVLGAAAVGGVAAVILDGPGVLALVAVSGGLAIVAQLGDLWESLAKRRFGVKDSGTLIPGHGGVLDRLDGFMAVAPAVALAALVSGTGVLSWV
jgi:phosphatidate cytidylyltransferase